MKKLTLTIAIILGITMTSFAEGGLFQRDYNAANGKSGYVYYERNYSLFDRTNDNIEPLLPGHGSDENESAAPLGSGIAVLMGLGAAYMVAKKRREE